MVGAGYSYLCLSSGCRTRRADSDAVIQSSTESRRTDSFLEYWEDSVYGGVADGVFSTDVGYLSLQPLFPRHCGARERCKGVRGGSSPSRRLRIPVGQPPWGKTYGTHSPMFRAYKTNAKLLMLGVDYESSTYAHLVEVIHWNKRLIEDLKPNISD